VVPEGGLLHNALVGGVSGRYTRFERVSVTFGPVKRRKFITWW
jgi:hypothetical protein